MVICGFFISLEEQKNKFFTEPQQFCLIILLNMDLPTTPIVLNISLHTVIISQINYWHFNFN